MKLFLKALLLLAVSLGSIGSAHATKNIENVFKIYAYKYNEITQSYDTASYGSAVYLGWGKIVTNAHVVLDEQDTPYKYYEVCKTFSFRDRPSCLSVASLKAYDSDKDLAYLTIDMDLIQPQSGVAYGLDDPDIGDSISILGYPATGGDTITLSEGKIAGYSDGYYKTDSDIDAGNSGGGAFNEFGAFIGMPTQIQSQYATIGYIIPSKDILNYVNGLQTSDFEEYDISNFIANWEAKRKKLTLADIRMKSIDVNSFARYSFELSNYSQTQEDYAEYFLQSKIDDTKVQVINIGTLKSDSKYVDIWKDFVDTDQERYIVKQINHSGHVVDLLVILEPKTQDISIYFYAQSSAFNIYGNMKDIDGIKNALNLYLSSSIIRDQESLETLKFQGVELSPQTGLSSQNYVFNQELSNTTLIDNIVLTLEFTELEGYTLADLDEYTYNDLLLLQADYDDYKTLENYIVSNKQGEILSLTKLESLQDGSITYAVNKYVKLHDVLGYYFIGATLAQDDKSFEKKFYKFLDTLSLDGEDTIGTGGSYKIHQLTDKY